MKNKIILFDGECNFCNYWVNFVLKYDKDDAFRFASLQSKTAKEILRKFNIQNLSNDTLVLIDEDNYFIKSEAVFKIIKYLKHWTRYFTFFKLLPKFFTDKIYDLIAKNRMKIIKTKVCINPISNIRTKFLD